MDNVPETPDLFYSTTSNLAYYTSVLKLQNDPKYQSSDIVKMIECFLWSISFKRAYSFITANNSIISWDYVQDQRKYRLIYEEQNYNSDLDSLNEQGNQFILMQSKIEIKNMAAPHMNDFLSGLFAENSDLLRTDEVNHLSTEEQSSSSFYN